MSTRQEVHAVEGDALVGTVLAGRYRIEQLLGSGGMGAVYRAEHVHMRKAVAVKVLHREMMAFPEVVARFEREAVAAGRIDHTHVVSASDFGQLEDGTFYLALEFVEGRSLAKVVDTEGALAPERALRIARQIAEALHAAHSVGIVHRDLKPDNVMLVVKDTDPDFVKVLDFGIAKIKVDANTEQTALTQIGTVFGTPEYMSPEQARGEAVDARADLYTVGVILHEMLSGVSPFKDEDLVVVLTRHLTADPPPLPEHVDPAISELVFELMKKLPAERVQTAAELIERIDLILGPPGPSLGFAGTPPSGPVSRARASVVVNSSANPSTKMDLSPAQGYAPTLLGQTARASVDYGAVSSDSAVSSSLLEREVQLGPRRVRVWILGLGAALSVVAIAALIVVASLVFGGKDEVSTPDGVAAKSAAPKDDGASKLVTRAESGDQTALAELTAKPEKKRSEREWRALGHGYAALSQFPASLAAYQKGAAAHPALAKDPQTLGDVRRAALDAQASEDALKLAASGLGADGIDVIYDVWEDTKSMPAAAAINKKARAYLDDDSVRAKASPALKLLLDVSKAQKEGCASVKKWLARAATEGDTRVTPLLKRFDDRRGCGFLGLGDCYGCLRASKDLSATADAVAARPGPEFTLALPAPSPSASGK
ncbi:MAG TPA: serine/threonine-protein kinase [Polyangiaceae bacterium]|nr:serine/threonine-protein kinase [Polyangiaceae bacterium]